MKLSEVSFKIICMTILAITLVAGWFAFDLYSFKHSPVKLSTAKVVVIQPGSSLAGIARQLQREGIIDHPRYLTILGRWHGEAARLQAGEYRIQPGMKPLDILDRMVVGDVVEYSLTVVEGWTFREMLNAVEHDAKLQHTLTGLSDGEIMQHLGADGEHPEGRFLPETYHFAAGLSDLDFLSRAYHAMDELLQKEWQQRAEGLPYKSPYEALIMASIIEKETAVPEERAEIAGVFVRRLQKHMRLQTDPTVIYGLGDKFDGNIRRRDLRHDTPYNTYTRHGLPPTPIALPGADSIHAALHPDAGDSLYFVAKGDGSHHFSATLAEHINAVRQYQLKH